jgi:hypothetical protein
MIRFATLALTLMFAFTFAACGTTNAAVKTDPTEATTTEATPDGAANTSGSKLQKKENGNMERAEQDE